MNFCYVSLGKRMPYEPLNDLLENYFPPNSVDRPDRLKISGQEKPVISFLAENKKEFFAFACLLLRVLGVGEVTIYSLDLGIRKTVVDLEWLKNKLNHENTPRVPKAPQTKTSPYETRARYVINENLFGKYTITFIPGDDP